MVIKTHKVLLRLPCSSTNWNLERPLDSKTRANFHFLRILKKSTPRKTPLYFFVLFCITSVTHWRDTTHFDSEDDYRTGCRNVSHCQQQQPYSGLRSPGRSNSTYFWNDSLVQTFHFREINAMVLKIKNGNLGEILTAWTNFLFSYFLLQWPWSAAFYRVLPFCNYSCTHTFMCCSCVLDLLKPHLCR